MSVENPAPAFSAFEAQLKTLCLNEFPCGIGTWRENHNKKKSLIQKDKVTSKFHITLKDYGASYEKTETLDELVSTKRSPWNLDYSWSDEAKDLREIAVRSPWLIDQKYVLAHFKTLRIVNKEVTEVDQEFLRFPNLQELTLSANHIRTVNSQNLPQSLKVLELCANEISHLADLCINPPPLIHLGLGYNLLTMVDDYITAEYWSELLSLDLSNNNLADLMDIVKKLQTLPKLRNVILQGNPLSLVPGYKGFVIDSLRKLDFLDDVSISADEKHHFKGLAKRKEYILDEAKIHIHVDFIKGILQPEELKNPDDQPEFPIVTRNYYVQFMFLEDKSANAEIFQLLHDQYSLSQSGVPTDDAQTLNTARESVTVSQSQVTQRSEGQVTQRSEGQATQRSDGQRSIGQGSNKSEEKTVNFSVDQDTTRTIEKPESEMDVNLLVALDGPLDASVTTDLETDRESAASGPVLKLAPIRSESSTWQEEMELDWHKILTRDDLLSLRDFCRQGMEINVMEEKISSYPADQVHDGVLTPTGSQKGKKDKKDDKKKDDKKAKKPATPQKNTKKDDGKKKKKKGEPDIELAHMPGEYTTLATFHAPLQEFLEGEFQFENVYVKSWESSSGTQTPMSDVTTSSKDKKDKKKSDKKKDKDAHKSPRTEKKHEKGGDKDKGKGKSAEGAGDDDPPPPPPPLEVHVRVKLHHWKTAMDSIREEEERIQEEERQQRLRAEEEAEQQKL